MRQIQIKVKVQIVEISQTAYGVYTIRNIKKIIKQAIL